ncbi:MAG: hypothetical protein ABIT04_07810 [Novosphingobium sp.]
MADLRSGEWLHMGIADVNPLSDGTLERVPFEPYVAALRNWQNILGRSLVLDDDPYDKPIDLADIANAARKLNVTPDADWH